MIKDREALLSFYDFPAEHWKHLRTTVCSDHTLSADRLRRRGSEGKQQQSGSGVYLNSRLIITAAHLTAVDAKMSVRVAGPGRHPKNRMGR